MKQGYEDEEVPTAPTNQEPTLCCAECGSTLFIQKEIRKIGVTVFDGVATSL